MDCSEKAGNLARSTMGLQMKIAFLITRSDTVGGAHIHLLDLASAAQADGHDVVVLVGGDGPYVDLLRRSNIRVIRLRFLVRPIRPHLDLLAILEFRKALRILRPDIIHLHSTKAGLVGRIAAKFAGLPTVFTAHGWAFTDGTPAVSSRLSLLLERISAAYSNAIICVSEYDRRLALKLGVGDEALLIRIHNGVPDVPVELRSQGGDGEAVRIVCVARLDAQKDHALLIDALEEIRDSRWTLELIGDGPLTAALKDRVLRAGLSNRVKFSGLCNDVPARLARADLFVLTSNWEGLPLSILEAMRAQLPVIASDVGGVSESLAENQTGFLVPKGNRSVLKDRLIRLLEDAPLRQLMGRKGREIYEQEFSFDVMYKRTLDVYRRVLDRGV